MNTIQTSIWGFTPIEHSLIDNGCLLTAAGEYMRRNNCSLSHAESEIMAYRRLKDFETLKSNQQNWPEYKK